MNAVRQTDGARPSGARVRRGSLRLAVLLVACGLCAGAWAGPFGRDKEQDIWAIRCVSLTGAQRFQRAEQYAELLRKVKGLRPRLVQVLHVEDESRVYYGKYKRVYDKRKKTEKFKPDPKRDLELVRMLSMDVRTETGQVRPVWPFIYATLEPLPMGRSSHPEWELRNAPGYYSLQVAVFYNTEQMRQRRYAAEQYCKLLREKGEEAYFDHGETNSSVCIGAFPKSAIQTYQEEDPLTGVIRVRSRIVDRRMLALQKKYPYNLHNGRIFYEVARDPKTGKKIRTPHGSFPVIIPHPASDQDRRSRP